MLVPPTVPRPRLVLEEAVPAHGTSRSSLSMPCFVLLLVAAHSLSLSPLDSVLLHWRGAGRRKISATLTPTPELRPGNPPWTEIGNGRCPRQLRFGAHCLVVPMVSSFPRSRRSRGLVVPIVVSSYPWSRRSQGLVVAIVTCPWPFYECRSHGLVVPRSPRRAHGRWLAVLPMAIATYLNRRQTCWSCHICSL